jgi:hypothetical protein
MIGPMEKPGLGPAGCGGAPSSRATVHSRALQRACEVRGGLHELAHHLRVSPVELSSWIEARAQPPLEVFLAAVDIVLLYADRGGGSA